MSAHLAVIAPPVAAARPAGLGESGLQGRRSLQRRDFRLEIRTLLGSTPGRHRVTFIPLEKFVTTSD